MAWRDPGGAQVKRVGAVGSGAPIGRPSSRNCTEVIPESSCTLAATGLRPERVWPGAGLLIVTEGGSPSAAGAWAGWITEAAGELGSTSTEARFQGSKN